MRHRGFILILACAALGSALAALSMHHAWQEARRAQVHLEASVGKLTTQTEEARAEAARHNAVASALEASATRAQAEVAEVAGKVERLGKAVEGAAAAIQARLGELSAASGEVKSALAAVKGDAAAQHDRIAGKLEELGGLKDLGGQVSAHTAAVDARLKANEAQGESLAAAVAAQTGRLEALEAAVRRVELALASDLRSASRASAPPTAPPGAVPPAPRPPPSVPVNATIEAVEPSDGIVVVAAGTRHGIEVGHELTVTRDGKRLGTIRVIKTYTDLAGAEIVDRTGDGEIQKGDTASTGAPSQASTPPAPPPGERRDPPPPPSTGASESGSAKQ